MAKCGTTSGQVDLWSDVPPQRHLVTKSSTTLGETDLWSDVTFPVKASSSQEWYYVSQLDIWSAFESG